MLVLQHLHQAHQVLHQDISPNNIMLVRHSDDKQTFECGLLIDFDFAAVLEGTSSSEGFRTVCLSRLVLFFILIDQC
jgi:serine/threonine protein kinase